MVLTEIIIPKGFKYKEWINRWDKMQEHYVTNRTERFTIIQQLIKNTQKSPVTILDIGCGTGSLMGQVLKASPNAKAIGVDFDLSLLELAKYRLKKYGNNVNFFHIDLRDDSWTKYSIKQANAVISATALHWLTKTQLSKFYKQIYKLLKPKGIFLNADHVGNEYKCIQDNWQKQRIKRLNKEHKGVDDWRGFWNDYSKALNLDIDDPNKRVIGGWEGGVEDGLPLAWHFDKLREAGFSHLDCFWRDECDAIYGGIKM